MEKIFEDYLGSLGDLHEDIKSSIKGLSQDALDWVPGIDMNSLCVIVAHVGGSQRFWIGDVVAGTSTCRDRDAEFQTRGIDAAELAKRLDESLSFVRGVLKNLSSEDLEAKRVSPTDGRETTAGWVLLHVLRHTAIHVGHVQITRQLWDQQNKQ